jgi:hypothetical protein
MTWLGDRLRRRSRPASSAQNDALAVQEYERLLLEDSPEGMADAQVAAVERLTTTQFDLLVARLVDGPPAEGPPAEGPLVKGRPKLSSGFLITLSVAGSAAVLVAAIAVSARDITNGADDVPSASNQEAGQGSGQSGQGGGGTTNWGSTNPGSTNSTTGGSNIDPSNIDPSNIDPSNIDPSNIDLGDLSGLYYADFWY